MTTLPVDPLAVDPELDEITRALSAPDRAPGAWSRRKFLGAAAVMGGMAALDLGGAFDSIAAAATPIGANDRVLVLLTLGGGNDGLNTVAPIDDPKYQQLRGTLAVQPAAGLRIDGGMAFHPSLAKLKARYDAGKVAVVRGVGKTDGDLSHFTSMATVMAGTSTSSRSSGWLGRYLDGLADSTSGLRGAVMGTSVPLHLQGARSVVTALGQSADLFGSATEDWERALFSPVRSFAASSTGKGKWADALARAGRDALDRAVEVSPIYATDAPSEDPSTDLTYAARLINANLGLRVISVSFGSFDTHDNQAYAHGELLSRLDRAIEAFFAALSPTFADRVVLATFSEFGRRAQRNDSGGTDHGAASSWFVIGNPVKGGLYGSQPSLSTFDSRGNLATSVDHRSVYATLIDEILGGDADGVLGARYERLGLRRSTKAAASTPRTARTPSTAWKRAPR